MYAEDFQSVSHPNQRPTDLNPRLILNQVEYLDEIRTILTHPFFTGQCPQCRQRLAISDRVLGESRCHACGWTEES